MRPGQLDWQLRMRARRYFPFLLTAILLLSAGWHLPTILRSFKVAEVSNDPATAWDAHMRMVADALPSDVSGVGYLDSSDLDPSIHRAVSPEFYLTQYGLAPTVVYTGADHDWIVGNFGKTLTPREIRNALNQKLGSYSIQDYGSGIYLIHRTVK